MHSASPRSPLRDRKRVLLRLSRRARRHQHRVLPDPARRLQDGSADRAAVARAPSQHDVSDLVRDVHAGSRETSAGQDGGPHGEDEGDDGENHGVSQVFA